MKKFISKPHKNFFWSINLSFFQKVAVFCGTLLSCELPHFPLVKFFFFFLKGLYLWHLEVPWLGVELELQLPAYTTAIAAQDPSGICDLQHSSWQHQILNPLSKARYRTWTLMDPNWFVNRWAVKATSLGQIY